MKDRRKHGSDIFTGVKVSSLVLASVLAAGTSPGWAQERIVHSDEVRTATFALG